MKKDEFDIQADIEKRVKRYFAEQLKYCTLEEAEYRAKKFRVKAEHMALERYAQYLYRLLLLAREEGLLNKKTLQLAESEMKKKEINYERKK